MEPALAAAVLAEVARERAARAGRDADVEVDVESFRSPMPKEHLQALAQELVENALKFSKPGFTVTIRGRQDRGSCLLSVEDQGRGMTAEQIAGLDRAPFLRRNQEQPGLGLGLTIVRRIAEMYGGQMFFDTAADRGTTASVRFAMPRERG